MVEQAPPRSSPEDPEAPAERPAEPLRVLFTLPWATRSGGAEEMLQELVDGGPAAGYVAELVFLEQGPWPAQLRAAGVRVDVLPSARIRHPHAWLRTVRRLAAIMRTRQPDLIVNWTAKTQLYGAPAAMLAGMRERVVWWQHAIPEGHWIDACATILPSAAIGATSRAAAEEHRRRFRPAREMFVVAAGTHAPLPEADPGAAAERLAGLGTAAGVPLVGLVARLQPWKGQDRLVQAAQLLRERGHPVHVLLVGGDSFALAPDYARGLPQLIERLGMSGHVTMTGEVPDAGPYIERMDVLVNASDPEPFGIVLLEGMARGVAVVAVGRGGPREIVEDGVTGVLARSGDPEALADAIEPLLASEELRGRVAAAGRERFLREFTDEAMCARFAAHVRELVAARERRGGR
ncbi:MAG TPA: glycosyltransferase [Solirubrobacteraceae bacterium]|nr:glycosyltransferase [Solirubrobacteraceae bacterium]